MRGYELPQPCWAAKAAIQSAAEKLASRLEFNPGDPIEPLVESLGGRIIYSGLSDACQSDDGSIVIEADGAFAITLPPLTAPERDRFTIAHELGHYFLHFPLRRSPLKARRYGSDRVEWEANWFAAGLLMPAREFRKAFSELNRSIPRVASLFGVSASAAEVRAKTLGLI